MWVRNESPSRKVINDRIIVERIIKVPIVETENISLDASLVT